MEDDLLTVEEPLDQAAEAPELENPAPAAEGEQPAEGESAAPLTSLFDVDGKKLAPAVKGILNEVKAKNPQAAQLLAKGLYRLGELDRDFPGGLVEARELRSKIEELGGMTGVEEKIQSANEFGELAQAYERADPMFVDDLIESYPESFDSLMPTMISRFAQRAPESLMSIMGTVVNHDMQANEIPLLMALLEREIGDKPQAVQLFQRLNAYMAGFKELAKKAPVTKAAPAAKQPAPGGDKTLDDRFSAWKTERSAVVTPIIADAEKKALAGRTPSSEEKAAIKELFGTRFMAAVGKRYPNWQRDGQNYLKRNDKAGYMRFVKGIYNAVAPGVMTSTVGVIMRGSKSAPAPKQGGALPGKPPAAAPAAGFKLVSKMPASHLVDWSKTDVGMVKKNQNILLNGDKVTWR